MSRENSDKRFVIGGKTSFVNALIFIFLISNFVIRFCSIFYYPPYNTVIAIGLASIIGACIFVCFFPERLKIFLFFFGFSFFLFGFPSIDLQSRIFELIITCVASTLFIINLRTGTLGPLNRPITVLMACYVALSLFSLVLLPLAEIFRDLSFFGPKEFLFYLFIAPPYVSYYSISAVIRLMLFALLAVQISGLMNRHECYRFLFSGLFSGAVFCAFIGLLDYYGAISLAWYRFGKTTTPGVLHSTFGNRGVFAEYILTVVPFVLIGFMSKIKKIWMQVFLFGNLVICEIALILAGARAGWVSYPLILFICWVFFYFSKEGRIESFHFKWKDLVKVVISVPITILISFLLIFQVLMPLSQHLQECGDSKGIQKNATSTTQYLKRQASRLIKPAQKGRLYTWAEGYHVGRESPLFGMGYEAYCWHAHILADAPESDLSKFYQKKGKYIHLTAHSIFFQLFASSGIVGLGLWILIVGYAIIILLFDVIKNKRLLNIPVIISIISFHTYGIFQSMQYMPMIWSLIFLSLGYAMTMDEKVLPARVRRVTGVLTKVSAALVVIGFFVYLSNFESKSLAEKYNKRLYAMDQELDRFAGFFHPSKRWKYGDYRWLGKKGAIYVPGGGKIELDFHCRTPELEKEPLLLTVFHDGRVLDEISFSGQKGEDRGRKTENRSQNVRSKKQKRGKKKKGGYTVRRKYQLPVTPGETQDLILEVSRTWNPHNVLGNFDRRELGLGVKIIEKQF